MHSNLRLSSYAVATFALVTTLVGCGAGGGDDETVAAPLPSDSDVYEASSETRADVGIVKWGFSTDVNDSATIFHGYGERNEVLVEIRQTLAKIDANQARFTMTMRGSKASGSERIDFAVRANADGKTAEASMNVVENTFDEGTVAARVLARMSADARSKATAAITNGSGSLTGRSRPLDALVTTCNDTVNRCQIELIDSRSRRRRRRATARSRSASGTRCSRPSAARSSEDSSPSRPGRARSWGRPPAESAERSIFRSPRRHAHRASKTRRRRRRTSADVSGRQRPGATRESFLSALR